MYKKITWIFVLANISLTLFAQKPEPVVARVFYKFRYQYDTIHPNKVKIENFVLLLGKTSSVYKSYDRMVQDSEMLANFKTTGFMAPPAGERAYGDQLFYFFPEKKYYIYSTILGNYLIDKKYEDIDWKIDSETKKIENITCQKATANYKGRKYIVWFSTSLPFKAGPWKLHGLPGLIVSAVDQTGRIRFDFSGFKQVKGTEETSWDSKAIPITWEDYEKMAKAYENDPQGMLEKRLGRGVHITTSAPMQHRNVLAPNPAINFPLEVGKQ